MERPHCVDCGALMTAVTIPLRLVWEGQGHDQVARAWICPNDDRHAGVIEGSRPRRLATGALRRLAYWGERDQQTRAKGLVRL